MSDVYFCADFHGGHKTIAKFGYRRDKQGEPIKTCEQNTEIFLEEWENTIRKNDVVYCLGDMAFDAYHHQLIAKLRGRKTLIKGNHDHLVPHQLLVDTYVSIEGTYKKYGMWLSHFPVHPQELWGKVCLHGHVHHSNTLLPEAGSYWELHGDQKRNLGRLTDIPNPWPAPEYLEDKRYLNLCPENTQLLWGKWIISLEEIRSYFKKNLL